MAQDKASYPPAPLFWKGSGASRCPLLMWWTAPAPGTEVP